VCFYTYYHPRDEAEVMKRIVKDILAKLDTAILPITNFPVGLGSRVEELLEFIVTQQSNVSVIGIWGMGGSGKTTTAKYIYNQIHRNFVHRSFIEDIREVCEKDNRGIIHLQQQLLSDILKSKEMIHSIASGTAMIERIFQGKRALVVLDDVTTVKQLQSLFRNRTLFGLGSVLIVTTRDVRILDCTMKEMDEKESLELFSCHAFGETYQREGFTELSRNVVAYCGGLPLALEVLGSYLYKRTKQEWKSVLSKLEKIPNDEVQEKLRISYDGLKDDIEKDIFLDICCFFTGKDRAYVTEILNGCELDADIGITILIERSLVKIEQNNKLGMHGLIRDMGREIVRESSAKEPGRRSRLWYHGDVHDVLTKNSVRTLITLHNLINIIILFVCFLIVFLYITIG
jgi:GTPase SAR1 family protein